MADPRIIVTQVQVSGLTFKGSFVAGPKGASFVVQPIAAPTRNPEGTQEQQSAARIRFNFDPFEVIADLVDSDDALPSFAPVITAQNLSIGEDGVLNFQLTATDLDENIDPNSWLQVGALAGMTINADGSGTYVPDVAFQSLNIGELGSVPFVAQVSDTYGQIATRAFNIEIVGAADAPTVNAVSTIITDANTVATFDLSASDPENDVDPNGWVLSTPPLKGVVTPTATGTGWTVDPNGEFAALGANDFEDITFGVKSTDLQGNLSPERIVTARITGTAKAPVAVNGNVTLSEDQTSWTPINLGALISDPDGTVDLVEMLTAPSDIEIQNFDPGTGLAEVRPVVSAFQSLKAGQQASRTFQFRGRDNDLNNSNVAVFTIFVDGADDLPVSQAATINVYAGEKDGVVVTATDPDSGLFNGVCFEFVGGLRDAETGLPAGAGSIVWRNDTNVQVGSIKSGRTQFDATTGFEAVPEGETEILKQDYRSRDENGVWGPIGTITIVIAGTAAAAENFPVMTPISVQTVPGQPVSVNLIDYTSDLDGDYSGWSIVAQPVNAQGAAKGAIQLSSDGTYPTGVATFLPGNVFDTLPAGSSEVVTGRLLAYDQNTNQSNIVNFVAQVTGTAVQRPPVAPNVVVLVAHDAVSASVQLAANDPDGNLDPNGYLEASDPGANLQTVSASGLAAFNPAGVTPPLDPGETRDLVGTYTAKDLSAPSPLTSQPGNITWRVFNNTDPGTPPTIQNITRYIDWQAASIEGRLLDHTVDAEGDIVTDGFALIAGPALGALGVSPAGQQDGYWRFDRNGAGAALNPGEELPTYFDAQVPDGAGNLSNIGRVTIVIRRPVDPVVTAPTVSDITLDVDEDGTIVNASVPVPTGTYDPNGFALVNPLNPQVDGDLDFAVDGTIDYDPNGLFNGLVAGQQAQRIFPYTNTGPTGLKSSPANIIVNIHGVGMAMAEPMYPKIAILQAKYPFEASGMARMMALEAAYPPATQTVMSGALTDPAVWSAGVPGAGQHYRVNYGHTLTLNEARTLAFSGNVARGFGHIHGAIEFAAFMNVRHRINTLIGYYGSHFKSRPAPGVTHELSFPSLGDIDVAKDPVLLSRGVLWMGTVDIEGCPDLGGGARKDPYVLVDYWGLSGRKPLAGDTTIILERAPVGWAVGDKIMLPCTEMNNPTSSIPTNENEERTIAAINGRVITLSAPLVFDHDELPVDANTGTGVRTHIADLGDGVQGGDRFELPLVNFTRQFKITNEAGASIPVHQRPHCMWGMHRLSGDGVDLRGIEHFELGRTDKLRRAFLPSEMGTNPIVADTNMKSRYGLHPHWCGVDPETDLNSGYWICERNSFYGSPGWHIAHHRGQGKIWNNVSYNAIAHYVEEAGDGTGIYGGGNVAIWAPTRRQNGATGSVIIPKQAALVNNHDHGATGNAAFFQGRLVEFNNSLAGDRNYCFASHNQAYLWIHRPPGDGANGGQYVDATHDAAPHLVAAGNWPFADAVAYNDSYLEPDKPNIPVASHGQVVGAHRGQQVVKNAPTMEHDARIYFDHWLMSGVFHAHEWEYTQHYTGRFWVMVGSQRYTANGRKGFSIFNNTPDITMICMKIGGFSKGIDITHFRTGNNPPPVAGAWGYIQDTIEFGAQCGLPANGADNPDFLETRTGQDGVTGPEDRAFNMSFFSPQSGIVKTFGPPPNPYSTNVPSFGGLYFTAGSPTPSPAAIWNFSNAGLTIGHYQLRGQVLDAYGPKPIPQYYGAQGAFSNPNDSMDIIKRTKSDMWKLLARDGYWFDGVNFYVEDVWVGSPRQNPGRNRIPFRQPISANTPGVNNNPPAANFGNQTFTFNGVKP